jgi:homoserine O-succinyltransferase
MMPDTALEATERQFFRLLGACNQIVQFHAHLFTIEGIERGPEAKKHIDSYYETFDQIKADGLDGLIISGANVTHANLEQEPFWDPLSEVFIWAKQNVTSILCSCLATHALVQHCFGLKRSHLGVKRWGVFSHKVISQKHPLVAEMNTRFDVPHSRFNEIFQQDLENFGIKVLVASEQVGAHLFVSSDGFRIVFFQGHPEFDTISLLKEFKREVLRYLNGDRAGYPPFPDNYFSGTVKAVLEEYRDKCEAALNNNQPMPEMPEKLLVPRINNTWHDTGEAVIGNWIGLVYQVTHAERSKPFMDGINPADPLKLK